MIVDLISKLDNIKSKQPSTDNIEISLESTSNKKKRKKQLLYKSSGFKRALIDPQPLYISDNMLVNTLKDLVGQIHGDFGRASVATGKIKTQCSHFMQTETWYPHLPKYLIGTHYFLRFTHNL